MYNNFSLKMFQIYTKYQVTAVYCLLSNTLVNKLVITRPMRHIVRYLDTKVLNASCRPECPTRGLPDMQQECRPIQPDVRRQH